MGKDKEKDVTNHISCSGAGVGHVLEHYQDNKNDRTMTSPMTSSGSRVWSQ